MRYIISLFIVVLMCGGQARADCSSDCQEDYQSSVESCKTQNSDPDDADDLKTCLDDARKEYESCVQECEAEAKSTDGRIVTWIIPASNNQHKQSQSRTRSLMQIMNH